MATSQSAFVLHARLMLPCIQIGLGCAWRCTEAWLSLEFSRLMASAKQAQHAQLTCLMTARFTTSADMSGRGCVSRLY